MSNESSERICEYCQRGSKPWLKNGIWLHEGGVSCAVPPAEADAQREPELSPCPFCEPGGNPWHPSPCDPVRCSDCGAEGPSGDDLFTSMEYWNTRSRPTVEAAEIQSKQDGYDKGWKDAHQDKWLLSDIPYLVSKIVNEMTCNRKGDKCSTVEPDQSFWCIRCTAARIEQYELADVTAARDAAPTPSKNSGDEKDVRD